MTVRASREGWTALRATGCLQAAKTPKRHNCCTHISAAPWRQPQTCLRPMSTAVPVRAQYNQTCSDDNLSLKQRASRRHYATGTSAPPSPEPPKDIAVLGGGLTGISTAYYLSRFAPQSRVTIYEASERLGGWVHSDKVEVTDGEGNNGVAIFERGPRTVQPSSARGLLDDLVLYELITLLGLTQEMDVVSKADWSKLKRFVFYPDHLVAMPSLPSLGAGIPGLQRAGNEMLHIIQDLMTEPVFAGFARAGFNVLWKQLQIRRAQAPYAGFTYSSRRDGDDSIGHFFARYLGGPELVDNVLSAMVHGIYGGDVWKISVQSSLFGKFHASQTAIAPSRAAPSFNKEFDIVRIGDMALGAELVHDKAVVAMAKRSLGWGGINFAGGFSVLTDAMVKSLRTNPNVQFRLGKEGRVQSLRYDESKSQVKVTTHQSFAQYDKIISTIYSRDLANLCPPESVPSLAASTAVDIQVVNLWYPNPKQNPLRGFGYLIPNSVPMAPVDQNPENALGVLFDSDRESILPSAAKPHAERDRSGCEGDTLPGTKLTVMLGGHHWAGMPQSLLPDAQEGARLARSVVQRSLGIPADAKVFASAKMARNAIPQHTVGHFSRMRAADRELRAAFHGRLAVAGTSYTAQGVLPALRAGRDVARTTALRPSIAVVRFTSEGPTARTPEVRGSTFPDDVGDTGLARFRNDVAAWTPMPKRANVFMREIELPMFSSYDNRGQ